MWNQTDLKCPALDICEYPPQDRIIIAEFQNLVTVLSTAADILASEHPVWAEIKVFQNVQAKYKKILQCDKCLQLLQRVGHCLQKMVLLNLSKSFLDLAERFLVALQDPASALFLPSRQQLEYVLIRTQSAAKLICEALKYSRETFCYLIQKLRIGHLLLDLMMAASVTARVNVMFKAILIQICDMYKKVFPWRTKLKEGNWKWPEAVNLPDDLEMWLKPEANDLFRPVTTTKNEIDFLSTVFKKKNGEDESDLESVILVDTKDKESDCEIIEEYPQADSGALDYGEVIPRNRKPNQAHQVLTASQNLLLQKILKAQNFQRLKNIWENIDLCSLDSLPQAVSAKEIKFIDKMFSKLKESIMRNKALDISRDKRKKLITSSIQTASRRLVKHLGFTENQVEACNKMISRPREMQTLNFEAVKSVIGLKKLFKDLYHMLQSRQEYDKCHELRKVYKRRTADIKLLKQNGEKTIAKKLIFCTSKVFLTMCQK